ncbi:MAG: LD-carboxypeptidase [Desulfobulbaceae bacterium]|nr:LD-carboxypeptidase [Desulfobulbaceae bacterium]
MNGKVITPPPLAPGDTIAVFAPAGAYHDEESFTTGVRILRDMGFRVKWPRDMWPGCGYFAANDRERVNELHRLIADGETQALIALRGGYGCQRLLPLLDFSVFRQNPKYMLGFSDITVLLNQLVDRCGLICLHGPTLSSLAETETEALEALYAALTGRQAKTIRPQRLEVLCGGTASGILKGGNLSNLVCLLGTPYDISWDRAIMLLEDINEPPHRLDRMLTQLALAGKFDRVAGLLLGDFTLGKEKSADDEIRYTEMVWQRIKELVGGRGIPVWGGLDCGHCPKNYPFFLGAKMTMDSGQGRLQPN